MDQEILITALILYVVFRIKHFICDFALQSNWMAKYKNEFSTTGLKAWAIHVGLHSIATLGIALYFAPQLWWLGPLDFVIHGTIDRLRAVINNKKEWTAKDRGFWVLVGIDQELHNYTHIAYIIIIFLSIIG